jgi:hypothetical protein
VPRQEHCSQAKGIHPTGVGMGSKDPHFRFKLLALQSVKRLPTPQS